MSRYEIKRDRIKKKDEVEELNGHTPSPLNHADMKVNFWTQSSPTSSPFPVLMPHIARDKYPLHSNFHRTFHSRDCIYGVSPGGLRT